MKRRRIRRWGVMAVGHPLLGDWEEPLMQNMDDRQQQMDMARNPQVGDWWHDHWRPQCLVIAVDDSTVTVTEEIETEAAGCWRWPDEPKSLTIMSRNEFIQKLSYCTMPDKLWARCVRRHNGSAKAPRT